METRNYEQETDVVITIVTHKREEEEAAERALFQIEVAAAAAKYRKHQKIMRKLYHWLNQISMVCAGVLLFITVLMCLYDGGWFTLLSAFATTFAWLFGRCCYHKSVTTKTSG